VWPPRTHRVHEQALVEEIGLVQRHPIALMLDPLDPPPEEWRTIP
jgi:hypothetical protein